MRPQMQPQMQPQMEDDKRALLFGRQKTHRRPVAPGVATASEKEMLESANQEKVDGLRGRVGEMRHVREALKFSVCDFCFWECELC